MVTKLQEHCHYEKIAPTILDFPIKSHAGMRFNKRVDVVSDLVVKHLTADPGIASSTPLTTTKITKAVKGNKCWFVLGKCFRVSVLYTGHVKNHVWWALQHLALWATNTNK